MRKSLLISAVSLFVGICPASADEPLPLVDILRICHDDAARLSPEARKYARYLDQHYEPSRKAREKNARVLSGHINGLSRESDIVRVVVLDADSWVVRVDTREYGAVFQKVYEQLTDADPYYHARVFKEVEEKTPWPGGVYQRENKYYEKGAFNLVTKRKVVEKSALSPILTDSQEKLFLVNDLVKWTGSSVFLVSAEFFFNQTAAAQDRTPNYYDFLGVKTEKDFQRLVGFDAKASADFGLTELREAVADSTVTLQPRALRRDEKIGGGYLRSFDFDKAVDRRNPLRVLGKDIEADYQASEQYGHLANGLWAMGIFNKQGERQVAAPGQIASDSTSRSNDKQVHVCASCVRCHSNGGLQSIDGWARSLFDGPPLKLSSPDFDEQKRLRQQYVKKLEPFIDGDRRRYEAAIKEATDWDSKEYSAAFAEMWTNYEDAQADLAWMATRLSVKPEELKLALLQYIQRTNDLDIVLSGFVKGRTIKIRQAEEVFLLAYAVLKGYRIP
jgi:hypothetical protein